MFNACLVASLKTKLGMKASALKDPSTPKHPLNGYFRFVATIRAERGVEIAGMTMAEQAKWAASLYRGLSEVEKMVHLSLVFLICD